MADQDILDSDDSSIVNGRDLESKQDIKTVNAKQLRESNKQSPGVVKLTDWVNEPSITDLKKDLGAAKPFRDTHVSDIDRWEILRNGGVQPAKRRGKSSVRPKLVRRQAEWRYSALSEPFLSSEDIFQVNPRTFEDTAAASQNAILLNWQFRTKINPVNLVNQAVRIFVDEGTVVFRPGWTREVEVETVIVPIYQYSEVMEGTPEEQALMQALELKDANPKAFYEMDPAIIASIEFSQEQGQAAWAVQVGEEEAEQEKIIKNHPTMKVVNYQNLYIDPSCGEDPEKAAFIVESFETSKAELMKDGRYKNLGSVSFASADLLTETEHGTTTPQDFNFDDEARKRIVAYEYWGLADINGTGELEPIVATWIDNQLIRMELNPFPDQRPPYVFASYSPKKRSVFGEPDAELLEDNQAISGALTRGMIDLLGRSANSQQGIQKGMLDITNRRRFESGEDYEFNPSTNPNSGLIQHKYPEIPRSALELLVAQNQEAEGLTGVKAFSGGISGEGFGDVAAGIRGTLDAASKREMDILRRLAEAFKQAAIKIIAMNGVFLSERETVRVTNETFVEIKREDLEGQFDLIIDISTPEIDAGKAADLSFMLQTAASTLPLDFTQMILAKIAKLRKMPELANEIKTYKPEPDPVQEALKQLELKKIELEIGKIQSEINRNNAQAEKFQADADSTDLATEMAGSGIAHQQDMEKQSEQARGNQDLAITKAMVDKRKPEDGPLDLEEALGFNQLTKKLAAASNQPVSVLPPQAPTLPPPEGVVPPGQELLDPNQVLPQ